MKKFLSVLVVLILLIVAVGLFTPTKFAIAKSITINGDVKSVHAFVGELKKWPEWAPWERADPTIKTTYGDKTTGVGAHQTWTSADGDGELTFTKCNPDKGIAYEMAFIMDDERIPATGALDYKKVDGGIEVTWTMNGDWDGAIPPVLAGWMRIMSPWMIGGEFDTGLEMLKTRVEEAK